MDRNGILSHQEKHAITQHLRAAGLRNCTNCTGSSQLELIEQVVTMRLAERSLGHETYFVAVKCLNCKSLRFYPATELGVTRTEDPQPDTSTGTTEMVQY